MGIPSFPTGVGLGLRWDFLDELLERLDEERFDHPVPFWEFAPENYMRRGGYIVDALRRMAEHSPLVSHGLQMSLGATDAFSDRYFAPLRDTIALGQSPWHSDHLCFSGVDGHALHDLLPLPRTELSLRHVVQRVREAQDRLELPFAIENISYYLDLGHHTFTEEQFIGAILEETGCHLLLDVNNVYVNSVNHGFDPRAFIEALDLSRVMQIHVAGHEYRPEDGLTIDTHGADTPDPVLELLSWTIERTGPVAVVLERDSNVPPLDALLDEHRRVHTAYRDGLARHAERGAA